MIPNISVNGIVHSLQVGNNNTITNNIKQTQDSDNNIDTSLDEEMYKRLLDSIEKLSGDLEERKNAENLLNESRKSSQFLAFGQLLLNGISKFNDVAQFIELVIKYYPQI